MAAAAGALITPPSVVASPADSLDAALRMIAGFQHRNKNQHRLSAYWWAPFQQLRRHAEKLRHELRNEQQQQQRQRRQRLAKKLRTDGNASACNAPAAALRARWVRLHLVPKAYLAFSRLLVDKQFAPLGLLLLGILAQIRAVLVLVAGDEKPAGESTVPTESHGEQIMRRENSRRDDDDDRGEAVVRAVKTARPAAESEAAERPKQKTQQKLQKQQKQQKQQRDNGSSADDAPQKLSRDDDDEAPLSNSTAEMKKKTDSSRRKKDKKDKKDKKRKRGGDEFDNLFSGLL